MNEHTATASRDMPNSTLNEQVVVVGGGFYGCCIALHLQNSGRQVTLLEQSSDLLTRASYHNQARVHNGYHYPRNILTGLSCVANLPRFVSEFRPAIFADFEKLYAIARINSKVTSSQFRSFCETIGAPTRDANRSHRALFDADLIESVFEVKEPAFNSQRLRQLLRQRLDSAGVRLCFNTQVRSAVPAPGGAGVQLATAGGSTLRADSVYICTYSQVNAFLRASELPLLDLKHEIAEMALVQAPPSLGRYGITVMDGPFFSIMPFPAESLHSLSHVRYTPRESWLDSQIERNPQEFLRAGDSTPRFSLMQRDAARYVPKVAQARYVRSFFETKTVLVRNETNDGRPILFRRDHGMSGFHIVLGGKLDNIYDVIQLIECSEVQAGK